MSKDAFKIVSLHTIALLAATRKCGGSATYRDLCEAAISAGLQYRAGGGTGSASRRLRVLTDHGMLIKRTVPGKRRGPPEVNEYAITAYGHEVLRQWENMFWLLGLKASVVARKQPDELQEAVRTLRKEALEIGEIGWVRTCDAALDGDETAMQECAVFLKETFGGETNASAKEQAGPMGGGDIAAPDDG